jgi:hypothetical protein
MSIPVLLKKLIDIEQSIGVVPNEMVRRQIQDVQDYALQIQKEIAEKLRGEHGHQYRAA